MKSTNRVISILLLVVWVSIANFSVAAQKLPGKGKPGPTNPTPTQDIKSPSKAPIAKPIGSCNSAKGCKALKAACGSKEVGGTYKPSNTEGTSGVCYKEGAKAPINIAAPGKDVRDAHCFTFALCRALKAECKGTWEQPYPNTGKGKCVD